MAQRQRRERERAQKLQTEYDMQPKQPTSFHGLPPSRRSRGSSERWAKRARVGQIPLNQTVDTQFPPVISPRNLDQDFNASVLSQKSSESALHRETPNLHYRYILFFLFTNFQHYSQSLGFDL